jgi:hypothetical protein
VDLVEINVVYAQIAGALVDAVAYELRVSAPRPICPRSDSAFCGDDDPLTLRAKG